MFSIATPDVLVAAGMILTELKHLNDNLSKGTLTMSASVDALTAEVAHVKDTLTAFLAKFNDALAQLNDAQGDEAAVAAATANLESIIAPIDAIVNPPVPPAPPVDQPPADQPTS